MRLKVSNKDGTYTVIKGRLENIVNNKTKVLIGNRNPAELNSIEVVFDGTNIAS